MMTPEDWIIFESRVYWPWGATIMADGYRVHFKPLIKNCKVELFVYVNGWLKGEYLNTDCEERRRFYQYREHYLWKKGDRKNLKRLKSGLDYDKKVGSYWFCWNSFVLLKKHLLKNNKDLSLVEN